MQDNGRFWKAEAEPGSMIGLGATSPGDKKIRSRLQVRRYDDRV